MAYKVEKQIRQGLPQVGVLPYGQVHAHSTGNPSSTAQNEADYHMRRPIESGFFSHVVGNGRIIQTAPVNRGAYDVGGGWNAWGYAQVELIESHKTKDEFIKDYKLYVELLRQLAKEANIPIKVDDGNVGILSHEYCTKYQPNNGSDHVDPYPYLAKWGISRAQFKKDVENGIENMSYKFEVGELVKLNPKATHYANRDKVSASDKAVTGIVTGVKTDKAVSNETKFIFVKALDNPKKINHWCLQRDVVSTGYKRVKK